MAARCIPIPTSKPGVVIHALQLGQRLELKDVVTPKGQETYVTCGTQLPDVCGVHDVQSFTRQNPHDWGYAGNMCPGSRVATFTGGGKNDFSIWCRPKCAYPE